MNVTFNLDPAQLVQLLSATVMPLLVGLVTTKLTKGAVKAWLLAGLTLITSVLAQLGTAMGAHMPFDVAAALAQAVPAFTISVATYYGLWKPTGIGEAAQDIEYTTLIR